MELSCLLLLALALTDLTALQIASGSAWLLKHAYFSASLDSPLYVLLMFLFHSFFSLSCWTPSPLGCCLHYWIPL